MSTNEAFDVQHPDMLIVGRSIAALGIGTASAEELIAQHIIWLDLDQIVHIQPLLAADATSQG